MSRSSDRATKGAGGRHGSPWHAAGIALVAMMALVGAGLLGAALNAPSPIHQPQPVAEAAADLDLSTPMPVAGPTAAEPSAELARSEPTDITISKAGINAKIISLGVNADGTVQVPPLKQAQLAGWYRLGPSPGEIGNAVIVGHVDSKEIGPAVFFQLGALRAGDTIQVARKDGSVVTFTVDAVKSYPKKTFPTELVYGPADRPSLRLVTCGGVFDQQDRSYLDNIIVFATLSSWKS